MAESWVRLWAGMTTDPKFRVISRKSGRPLMEVIATYTHLMLLANEAEDRGEINEDAELIAAALDAEEEHIEAILSAMQGRVIEGGRLSGWDKRQPQREDSGNEKTGAMSAAERKRLQRDREKERDLSRDVTACHDPSRDVTACHAPEAEAEAEIKSTHRQPAVVAEPDPPPAGAAVRAMRQAGISDGNPSNPRLQALLREGMTVAELTDAAGLAAKCGKGFAYALATAEGRRRDAAKMPPLPASNSSRPDHLRAGGMI